MHGLNKCKWRSCNSAGGFFYCRHSHPPLPARRLPAADVGASRCRDNKFDSLLVLNSLSSSSLLLVRPPPTPMSSSTVAAAAATEQEAQFWGECLFRVCMRQLHSRLTRDREADA